MSNLTKALAVVSLLAPTTGLPLSIGDIELHSTLNQALNAEIRLQVAPGENPSDVSVRLAPPEKFDQAGIPWSYFLSRIKFQPVVQADGSIIVKLTSHETLTEPFLDLLLEVTWPQGSQFREFTVLVDPPAAYRQPALPAAQPSTYRVEPLEEYERPVRKARPSARKAKSTGTASAITPQTPTSGEFGPVQQADTLWRIATQLAEERGVPARQMMEALYNANPDAFSRNDMNSLRAGAVLKIPEMEALQKPTERAAATRAAEKPAAKAGAKPLELEAPVESKIGDKAVVSAKPGQVGGEAGKAAAGEAGKAAGEKDLELQARIDKLEQQLAMMQQLLSLKDQQLAAMQGGAKVGADGKPLPVPEQPVTPAVQPPVTEPVAPQPQPVQPPQPEVAQPQPPVVPPQPAPAPVPPPAPKPVPPVQPTPAPVQEEESVFISDAYYVTMGGLGAGILGVLGWLLWRRRKIEEQTNTESMFASASEIRMPDTESSLSVPAMELGSSSSYDVGTVGESSFISDFTPSDFDAFDTEQSEVDPLSEADVYLAYGRYQQAEELIRHALVSEPGRDDFKLKLLEIFYAGENKEGFAAYAEELAEEGKQADRSFWNKVTDMAKEIVPDSPLFGGKPSAAVVAPIEEESIEAGMAANADELESDFGMAGEQDNEVDFELPADESAVLEELNAEFAEMKRGFADESKPADNGLDFDLGLSFDSTEIAKADKEALKAPEIESIDFDLSSFSLEEPEADKSKSGEETLETFDFNFNDEVSDEATGVQKSADDLGLNLEQAAKQEEFDFSSFDLSEPEITMPSEAAKKTVEDADEFDFNFDFDAPVVSSGEAVGDEIDLGVSDLTDMDEFETKIDLAKAYLDMGDADAAKSIAEEVLAKGSQKQKDAAQALLDELK